jgi:DNA-binding GntR family transcriptional regulator
MAQEPQAAASDLRDTDGLKSARHAYERLRAYILDGTLEPGHAFSQVQLAQELGISRTPLREAVRLLQMEGLVLSEYNRRVTVAPATPGVCDRLYAMRIALEPLAVQLTVPLLSERDLAEIGEDLKEMAAMTAADDYEGGRGPHRRFHMGLAAHAGDPLRARVADMFDHAERFRLLYSRQATSGPGDLWQFTNAEHQAIYDAACARRGARAGQLLADHLGRIVLTTLAGVASRYDPQAVRAALDLWDSARSPA